MSRRLIAVLIGSLLTISGCGPGGIRSTASSTSAPPATETIGGSVTTASPVARDRALTEADVEALEKTLDQMDRLLTEVELDLDAD
ncbi:MAG: hypothetical protein AAF467_25745 [Actinomycetota bacterium]